MTTRMILLFALTALVAFNLEAQLPPATASRIDAIAAKVMEATAVPSVSLAVINDGKIAYVHAYGNANLDPAAPARPEMRYCIGSVSKQFLAMAMLLLVQDGKLKLEDPVARYLPNLTRAKDITIRQLLSHTSGYQDYYPLDYVAPFMTMPVTPDQP
jgi:CubicO group peptidase (beta-lactamase class C family)